MGKKRRHSWPDAKKLCHLNRDDVKMARHSVSAPMCSFEPDLIRSRNGSSPYKEWVRELYHERFGRVPCEKPLPAPASVLAKPGPEATRQFEEQLYWEDYWDRNEA
jgi:hypothetical protein